jgi:hypothetical protein
MKIINKLWIGLGVLIVLSPLGLILPDRFKAGSAWGEWGADEMVPQGLKKLSELWNSPMPDYAFKGWEEKGLQYLSVAYIVSAIVGIGIIILVVMGIGKLLTRKDD